MLNTDAQNPNIKKENKMTKEQFIRNNLGKFLTLVCEYQFSFYIIFERLTFVDFFEIFLFVIFILEFV